MVGYNKYTIYYLSSLPTKDELKSIWIAANAGGKKGSSAPDPSPGPSPTPGPDPEAPEVYSCKKLVDFITKKFYTNFSTATSIDGIKGVQIISVLGGLQPIRPNSLFIGYSINSIFDIPSTSPATYYKWKDANAGTSPELVTYAQFIILPIEGKWGSDRPANEWENITSGNETLQIGDIIEFIDSSNRYIYVGVYLGTVLDKKKVVACGNNFKSDKNMPSADTYTCLLTMDELKEKINYTKYYVTRCKRSDRNG